MNYKLAFSTFTIFYTIFVNINWVNPTLFGWISNSCLLLFIIVNYEIFKNIFNTKYRNINAFALIFTLIIIYSGYINAELAYDIQDWSGHTIRSLKATRPDHAIYESLRIISYLLYFQHLNKIGADKKFLIYFFYLYFIYTIISDINALTYSNSEGVGYLVGNKFSVSYTNLLFATLYFMQHPLLDRQHTIKLKLILLLSFIIAVKTECTTAIIGTILMYIFIFRMKETWKAKLYKWQTYLLILFICDILFFFFTSFFINNPLMEYIIVDLLGKDLTLTGRIGIYVALSEIIQDCPLYGYGFGNAHIYTTMSGIGPNAQNGLFNLILEVGILGCISFFLMILGILKVSNTNKFSYPIICIIYTMLILSSIEITFSTVIIIISMFLILNNHPKSIYTKHQKFQL